MAGPKQKVWEAEPHTLAKHAILKSYLEAWFPILSSTNGRLVYFDGFSGPGIYSNGEKGSPIIALEVAAKHRAALAQSLVFTFVEERSDRAECLAEEVQKLHLPSNFEVQVLNDRFAAALGNTLDELDERNLQIAPTFALVDPFGITGLPFSLIERLLSRDHCEVLITFMTSRVNRWVSQLPDQINELIGDDSASEALSASNNRVQTARELYAGSLGNVAKFVRFFEMRDAANSPIYDLFFASNHHLGHYRMKEAMWKVDSAGDYRFSDGVDPSQAVLFSAVPASDLATLLASRFSGLTVDTTEILAFTRNETAYLERHARDALKLLETDTGVEQHRISVKDLKTDGSKRRRNTYPEGTVVTFLTGATGNE